MNTIYNPDGQVTVTFTLTRDFGTVPPGPQQIPRRKREELLRRLTGKPAKKRTKK